MSAQHTEPAADTASQHPPVARPSDGRAQPSGAVAEQIEAALLGGPRRHTRVEAARAAGVDLERCRRIWLALGFAEVDDDARVFTEQDVAALRAFVALVETGKIAPEEEVPHVRAIGQAMSRLADWQVREIMARISPEAVNDQASRAALAGELTGSLLPMVQNLQSYTWRRHLVAAARRLMLDPPEEVSTSTLAVGFADIVGFTSTVRHAGISELAGLLESFEENAAEIIVSNGGRVVKSLGDEVLFAAQRPKDAAQIALRLSDPGRAADHLPELRIGMALGTVLTRLGDVYGPTVNLASRLTSLAKPGRVLVDKALAQALHDDSAYQLRARRPVAVRGYHHLRSWALTARSG